eukprot:5546017-Amphidinium_carterae.1
MHGRPIEYHRGLQWLQHAQAVQGKQITPRSGSRDCGQSRGMIANCKRRVLHEDVCLRATARTAGASYKRANMCVELVVVHHVEDNKEGKRISMRVPAGTP